MAERAGRFMCPDRGEMMARKVTERVMRIFEG